MMATPYRVLWLPDTKEAIRTMGGKAGPSVRRQIASILREVDARLSYQPATFGEIYRSTGPIAEHLGVHDFLAFDIAIDEHRQFVLVRYCRPLSGRGLD